MVLMASCLMNTFVRGYDAQQINMTSQSDIWHVERNIRSIFTLRTLVMKSEVHLLIPNFLSLQYFQKDLPEIVERDPEQLFNLAFSMKINTKQMKKWEKEYAAVRKKEQEEMGELRVRIERSICWMILKLFALVWFVFIWSTNRY